MSGGGGGGNTTTVQKADPWVGIQPYLKNLYSATNQWFQSPTPLPYPQSTVAGQAPETLAGQQATIDRALTGSPLEDQAKANLQATLQGSYLQSGLQGLAANPLVQNSSRYINDVIGGAYLNANPYLDYMYGAATQPLVQQFQNTVLPGIASQFAAGGRYGSNAQASALSQATGQLGQTLGSTAANIYGNAYQQERALQQNALGPAAGFSQMFQDVTNQERERQQAAMLAAPGFAGNDYRDIAQLMGIGQQRSGYEQQLLNSDIARWDYLQNQPLQKLQAFNAILSGASPYGTTSSSQNQGGSGFNPIGALGGASTALSLAGGLGAATTAAPVYEGGALLSAGGFTPIGLGALALGALAGSGLF